MQTSYTEEIVEFNKSPVRQEPICNLKHLKKICYDEELNRI